MIIYVLEKGYDYEGSFIVGIYSSLEEAKEEAVLIEEAPDNFMRDDDDYSWLWQLEPTYKGWYTIAKWEVG